MKKTHGESHLTLSEASIASWVAFLFLLSLTGCVTPDNQRKPVSLEEAKKITVTFEGQAFTPPPRRITDITKILSRERPEDLKSFQRALEMADSPPPDTKDPLELANFYLQRGHAAHEAGRAKQEIDDYRLAVK